MAGRPGRDRLIVAARAARPRRPLAVLAPHLVLAAALAVGAASTAWISTRDARSVDVLGLLFGGELVLLGVAGGIAAGFDRFGPILLVDALVATAAAAGVVRSEPSIAGVAPILTVGLVVAGLAAGVAAAIRVRGRAIERILVAVALIGLAVAFGGSWTATVMPLVALCVVAAPDGRRTAAPPGSSGAPRRPRLAPDPAGVLARRDGGRDDAA